MINAGRPSDALKVVDQHPDLDGLGFLLPRILALRKLRRANEVPRLLTEPAIVAASLPHQGALGSGAVLVARFSDNRTEAGRAKNRPVELVKR